MTTDLVIITPEIVPGSGGVADHTLALLRHWPRVENLSVLAARPGPISNEAVPKPAQLAPSRRDIVKQLPTSAGKVFVQYSGYGYDRVGYPRELIRALIEWRRRSGGRLVVLFHEIWAFWSFINRNFFVQQLHRRDLKRLLDVCDVAFTTTISQAEHLRGLSGRASIQVLPVGSNIRMNEPTSSRRQTGVAVLFGLQSNRVRTLEKMGTDLTTLANCGLIKRIVCLGRDASFDLSQRERQLLANVNLPDGFTQQGAAPEATVSELLSTAEFGLFGQSALSCTKSGSFMAYAAHQLNVLAEFANPSDPPPVCWLVSPAELLSGIDRGELDRRAECLRMWQEQNCSWSAIAARLGRALAVESEPNSA